MTRKILIAFAVVFITLSRGSSFAIDPDINTILLRSSFKIIGQNGLVGTCFIIGKHIIDAGDNKYRYVLVTAAHVLDAMPGDNVTVVLRKKVGEGFERLEHVHPIRANNSNLYVKHPEADVAVMYIALPPISDRIVYPETMLATDSAIEQYEVHPGKEVLTIGFPYAFEGNAAGFPIIRSGRISSYPLLPTKFTKTFVVDFNVFGGNSGGPVYLYDSDWHKRGSGIVSSPTQLQIIMGLVSSQAVTNTPKGQERLGLANVVHASIIKETIDLLK
jgi:S1-C subfamily serine protease